MSKKDWSTFLSAIFNWSLVAICTVALWAMGVDPHFAFLATLWIVFHERLAAFVVKWWCKLSSVRWRA